MRRYLTTYSIEADQVECFTEADDYAEAIDNADEWVWQHANSAVEAKHQHFAKHDEWSVNPDKKTY